MHRFGSQIDVIVHKSNPVSHACSDRKHTQPLIVKIETTGAIYHGSIRYDGSTLVWLHPLSTNTWTTETSSTRLIRLHTAVCVYEFLVEDCDLGVTTDLPSGEEVTRNVCKTFPSGFTTDLPCFRM